MRSRLCAYLARCFNAHLSDDQKRFADDAAKARRLASELNTVLERLSKGDSVPWIKYRDRSHGRGEYTSFLRIDSIQVEFTRRTKV